MEGKAETGSTTARHLAHLGHELRSPLTAIIGYADAMRAGVFGPLDQRYAEYAEIIEAAGRHMLALAEDLLGRAGVGSDALVGPFAVFDAAEPVEWALRLLRLETEAAGVTIDFTPNPLRVTADRAAIARMVINLVANAVRFTPTGGTIRVTLEVRDGAVVLSVADTGSGIAPGSTSGGSGLGIVRELAEAHGGTLMIATSSTRGTRVMVTLPIVDAPA